MKRKKDINTKFLNSLFSVKTFETEATSYGKRHENDAKSAYAAKKTNVHIHDCGLVVNNNFSFLGASPDGKVCERGVTGLLEVKCPFLARDMQVMDAVTSLPLFCLELNGENLRLKKAHDYYFQVQGQLLVTSAPFCDFAVYTSKDIFIERILPDSDFQLTMLKKLSVFYRDHAMPFLSK